MLAALGLGPLDQSEGLLARAPSFSSKHGSIKNMGSGGTSGSRRRASDGDLDGVEDTFVVEGDSAGDADGAHSAQGTTRGAAAQGQSQAKHGTP